MLLAAISALAFSPDARTQRAQPALSRLRFHQSVHRSRSADARSHIDVLVGAHRCQAFGSLQQVCLQPLNRAENDALWRIHVQKPFGSRETCEQPERGLPGNSGLSSSRKAIIRFGKSQNGDGEIIQPSIHAEVLADGLEVWIGHF